MPDSEKVIEPRLNAIVKKAGGWTLKLSCFYVSGLPDRIVLLPGGVIFFMELKSTKKGAKRLQKIIHRRLRRLGFEVYVIDTLIDLELTLNTYLE